MERVHLPVESPILAPNARRMNACRHTHAAGAPPAVSAQKQHRLRMPPGRTTWCPLHAHLHIVDMLAFIEKAKFLLSWVIRFRREGQSSVTGSQHTVQLRVLGGMLSQAAFCSLHPCPQSLLYRCRLLSGVGAGGRSCISTQVPSSKNEGEERGGVPTHERRGKNPCHNN